MDGSHVGRKQQHTCHKNLVGKVLQLLDAPHVLLNVGDEPIAL
jgi:hypothetical protein